MAEKKRLDLNKGELEKLLQESWDEILARYHHPLIRERPVLQWATEKEKAMDDAGFEREKNVSCILLSTHKTIIAEDTLQLVLKYIRPEVALRGLITHEIGHYCEFPRDLATFLFLEQVAISNFGKDIGKSVLGKYLDMVEDTENLRSSTRKDELSQFYQALSSYFRDSIAEESDGQLMARTKPNRLMLSYYQKILSQDFGLPLEDELKKKLEELKSVDFSSQTEYGHSLSLIAFGNIFKSILFSNKGNNPFEFSGSIELEEFSNDQLQEALNKIAKNHSKLKYDEIKSHLKAVIGDKAQGIFRKNEHKLPGMNDSLISFNDNEIEYYERMASINGVYIARKPLVVDIRDPYPERCSEFSFGDPIEKLNPFSSGGRVLPAITKKFEDGYGIRQDKKYSIPDAVIILDSSGSMTHPAYGSYAVLAGFILAMNYYKNGKKVGVMNFSTDIFAIEPTRDIDSVYSALCAYYGGGTVLNINKVKEYFLILSRSKEMDKQNGPRDKVKGLSLKGKGIFNEVIDSKLEKKVIEVYNRIDNFIISDGGIGNIAEMVGYLNSIAKYTRNTIFLIQNQQYYAELSNLNLPNTNIIDVQEKSDLVNLAIGKAKSIIVG